jgi:hypothetical protein
MSQLTVCWPSCGLKQYLSGNNQTFWVLPLKVVDGWVFHPDGNGEWPWRSLGRPLTLLWVLTAFAGLCPVSLVLAQLASAAGNLSPFLSQLTKGLAGLFWPRRCCFAFWVWLVTTACFLALDMGLLSSIVMPLVGIWPSTSQLLSSSFYKVPRNF